MSYIDQKLNPIIVIMSCQKNSNLWINLNKYSKKSIIFCGDPNLNSNYIYKDRILYLKCEDTYDHLPTKVFMMINAILDINEFSNVTHIFKVDDHDTHFDNNIMEKIKKEIKIDSDYCGQKLNIFTAKDFRGNTTWHYKKCPISSIWHNKPFLGKYVPWCDGGCGYLLSRKSMKIIVDNLSKENIYKKYIYEDLMIATVLFENNIHPKKIKDVIIGDK